MNTNVYQYLKNVTAKDVWQIIRYGVSGVIGGILQVYVLHVCVDRLGMWYIYGVICAYLISFLITFLLQKFWTFGDYSVDSFRYQSYFYTLVAVVALILNVLLMYVLVDFLHFWHMTAQIVVVGIVGAFTFLMNKKFTFKNKMHIQ